MEIDPIPSLPNWVREGQKVKVSRWGHTGLNARVVEVYRYSGNVRVFIDDHGWTGNYTVFYTDLEQK